MGKGRVGRTEQAWLTCTAGWQPGVPGGLGCHPGTGLPTQVGRAGRTGCRRPRCPAGPEPLPDPGRHPQGPPPRPLRLRSPGRDCPQSVFGDVSATFGYDHCSTPHITSLPGTIGAAAPAHLGPVSGQRAGEMEHLGLVGCVDGGLLSLLVELSTAGCAGCRGSIQGESECPGLMQQW